MAKVLPHNGDTANVAFGKLPRLDDLDRQELLYELIENCRAGKMDRVQYLIEFQKTPVNFIDRWDANPLYYASLCGHESIVKYLLEKGFSSSTAFFFFFSFFDNLLHSNRSEM
jgi:ankyrin repeat protein